MFFSMIEFFHSCFENRRLLGVRSFAASFAALQRRKPGPCIRALASEPIISNIAAIVKEKPELAILIPCYNEEITIGKVIDDFRTQLPEAEIYVFDNCCTDRTAEIAGAHGAHVIHEPRKGKGFVIESMLDTVKADFYVLVDGDDTYPAESVHALLVPVRSGKADMAVGARLSLYSNESFRSLHIFGNRLVCNLINKIFHAHLSDIMSGYRAFNRRVIQRIPIVSSGFEVETELTVQMLYYKLKIVEIDVPYRGRPGGSISKLRSLPDGMRVLWKIFSLFRSFKPLTFFGTFGIFVFLLSVLSAIQPVYSYIQSGYREIPHSTLLASLAASFLLLSFGLVFLGLLLHAINWRFKELHNIIIRRHD
jgi:glycosyltransferase involved in cell wall biosynthesis